ncbi:MAG TPA: 2-oxo acid dehydrogenase subunit E2 [Oligoflexus sp.]|uniref:2-oxo acid dehydrogenase subunit E2 n=1 Tax=Oligoflexus sp. TaxID=1971216 RepID=UPI002D7EC363|nr:2-oxo acid dehydrogenase subunit E2 [Oligoflexus sp.]HET9238183.1 2-oxo acid dehydrogenase subunit E2 [Oligoflexus sp.]
MLREGIRPTIAEYDGLPIKILINQKNGNDQNVMAVVIPRAESCSAAEIQSVLDEAKAHGHSPTNGARLKRLLGHLPMPLAALLSKKILQDFKKRGALQGSVAISSLGHARVDTFLPQIFGSLGFGLGTISRRAAVIHDRIEIRPMMTLAMVFDHRIMDGATAAEILAEVKSTLEN